MKLPVIDKPIYKTNVLSRKEPIEFTPFTMKEAKILMMARESKEIDSIVSALRQILGNCLVDKSINVNELPMIDLEWLFLNIQAKSSGEIVNLVFKCNNLVSFQEIGQKECGMLIDVSVNLLNVSIKNKEVQTRIMISEDVGIQMKLPTFEMTKNALTPPEGKDEEFTLAALCIDYVFDKENVYYAKDATLKEMIDFVEQLPQDKYEKIEYFFTHCPTIKETIVKKCPKCEYEHTIELEGLEDFFS